MLQCKTLIIGILSQEILVYHLIGCCEYNGATVCKTVRPMLSVRFLSCLSVTFVHCGQTVGWIEMKFGMQVGLGPGHIVLDGDPAPPPQRDTASPNFRPKFIVAKRLDGCSCYLAWWQASAQAPLCQMGTPPPKGDRDPLPNFRPISIVAKRLDASRCHLVWMQASAQGTLCQIGTQPLHQNGAQPPCPIFGPFLLWPNG